MNLSSTSKQIVIRLATQEDREMIYRRRHDVYACELGQHPANAGAALSDALDEFNVYLVARCNGALAGFVSITPPGFDRYSIDKYFSRADFPELQCDRLHEIRLLTVMNGFRGREIAGLLMYAALRWIENRGGKRIVAIGRREVLDLYLHVGLEKLGRQIRSGAVTYELLSASTAQLSARTKSFAAVLNRFQRIAEWQLDFPFAKPAACFHGGAFFDAIGVEFDNLKRRHEIINADVLDAWFAPSPKVLAALQEDLPWLLRTSPPAGCEGMVRAIARARGVPARCVLPGAGSSDLIFLALRHWLKPGSRVLILDPTYGEYAHVLEQVVRCRVDRFPLERAAGYEVDLAKLQEFAARAYDLIVLVNPNSPTGRHVPREKLEAVLRSVPLKTRVWIDETYVEYAGADQSLERFAVGTPNVVICKSMSKVYALSGVRAAYLCGPADVMDDLRAVTPPWAVSLPAQVAAVAALRDPVYYAARYVETHRLRGELAAGLSAATDWEILPGIANFLLCHLPKDGVTAEQFVKQCRAEGLFLRDAAAMGRRLGTHALRIAIKDEGTNRRMLEILKRVNNGFLRKARMSFSIQPA
jgi:histidinol-phosphate/aromatic aminotransferase/cobyric acid decarboxylase-like protein